MHTDEHKHSWHHAAVNGIQAHLVAQGSSVEVFDEGKKPRVCTLHISIAFTLDNDTVERVLSGQLLE